MNVLFAEHAGGAELVRAVRGSRTSQVRGAGGGLTSAPFTPLHPSGRFLPLEGRQDFFFFSSDCDPKVGVQPGRGGAAIYTLTPFRPLFAT